MRPTNFIDETAEIGEGSIVWHYATVLANVKIGKNCSIGSHAEIGRGTVIGDNTRIGAGAFLPSNSRVGHGVFIAPGVQFGDDLHPRANNANYDARPPLVDDGASVGMGTVVLPGIHIGVGAMVGAGSVVTHDVEAHGHVRGEPARSKSYSRAPITHQELYAGPAVSKGDEHIA